MKWNVFAFLTLALLHACSSGANQEQKIEAEHDQEHREHVSDYEDHNDGHSHSHHGDANEHMHQRPVEDLIAGFEDPQRLSWQKPDSVLDWIGDLSGKVVMDLGAGSGYFSFPMQEAGASVIAADVNQDFLDYIDSVKLSKSLGDDQLETRLIPYDDSGLEDAEADLVICVNTYHHIEDRPNYFADLLTGLKEGGELVIVDYKRSDGLKKLEHGPPMAFRISASDVISELQLAGFSQFEQERKLLKYQYILRAKP
jgi:2-polyprenyl-3-methyl-5-hydroxy-6-metoxy-1,4-benzoquinol methylase